MARTPRPINWELVEKAIEAGCTATEIGGKFGLSVDQFYKRFEQNYNETFSEYTAINYSAGDFDLKLTAHLKALKGIPSILLRYCEERLGWGKSRESMPHNQPDIDKDHLIMIQAAEILALKAAYANFTKTE